MGANGPIPRLYPQEGKGLGTLKHFLGLAYHDVTARSPIQTYANNHMIAELAEPRIGTMSPESFVTCMVGSGNETRVQIKIALY